MVVVQPEQYVSYMLELHDHEALADSLVDILMDADSERRILRNPVRSVSMTSALDLGGLVDDAEAGSAELMVGHARGGERGDSEQFTPRSAHSTPWHCVWMEASASLAENSVGLPSGPVQDGSGVRG